MPDAHLKTTAKKDKFAPSIASEKHERVARRSLHDIIVFHQSLEAEMQQMQANKAKGQAFDMQLFDRMAAVNDKYKNVISGFLELDGNSQRHALITFADAIQDLMKYIHMRKAA